MAKFMMIFRGGDAPRGSPEQLQQHMQRWMAWFQGLTRDGVYHDQGAPLEPGGRVVRGARAVSDGPYAEAKDLVGELNVVVFDTGCGYKYVENMQPLWQA